MGFIGMLNLLLGLLPTIMQVVKAVEAAVPQSGQGAHKLNAVLSAVQGVALAAPAVIDRGEDTLTAFKVGDVPGIADALTHMIGATVTLFNSTGAFSQALGANDGPGS